MIEQKGFTVMEALIVASLGIVLTAGSASAISHYAERKDMENRTLSTAEQMIAFAEASFKLTSGAGTFNSRTITIDELKDSNLLDESFPEKTPYGQEVKGFLIENPDDNTLLDLMISTTGTMGKSYIERSGQSENYISIIQEKVYLSMRRQKLQLSNIFEQEYYFGMVKDNLFLTDGNIYSRDVSDFTNELNVHKLQPAILLTTPSHRENTPSKIQAIEAHPNSGIPADNSSTSTITISVRDNYGAKVEGVKVLWSSTGGTLSDVESITDDRGMTSMTIKNSNPGDINVTARLDDSGDNKSVHINFITP